MNPRNVALLNEWHDWAKPRRRHQTVWSYMRDYRSLAEWLGPKGFAEVGLADLEAWLDRRGEVAPATRQREAAEIRSLFKWLHQRGHTPTNPAAELVGAKVANIEPKPVADGDWVKLWSLDLDPVERVAFGIPMFCGLRRQEMVWLTKGQFTAAPTYRIKDLLRKGGNRMDLPWMSMATLHAERLPHLLPDLDLFTRCVGKLIRIGQPTAPLLAEMSSRETVSVNSYAHAMARRAREAGVSASPHMLRHACATNLIRMGVEVTVVSRLLGHGSLDMTMRYVRHAEDPIAAYLAAPQISDPADPVVELRDVRRYS